MPPMDQPRTALVTGSARRVGRALAAALVEAGWRVVVHATETDRARAAAVELGAVAGLGADLRDPAEIQRLAAELRHQLGGSELALLVNNAATFVRRSALETTLDDWHDAMDVNTRAPLLLTKALAPDLRAARGLVLNVSDRSAYEHWAHHAVHSASKAALDSLTITLARDLHPDVRVNAVAPGTILPPDDADPAWVEGLRQRGELGSPQQLVDAVFELLADPTRSGEIVVL